MNASDLATFAEFLSLADAYLTRDAASVISVKAIPCRDEGGRFASCGIGSSHRRTHGRYRQQDRRRKPRDADHAGWLKHFRKERRDWGRHIKRERKELRRDQRRERRALNRDSRKDAAKLRSRHVRETAASRNPARTAERHREERAELASEIRQSRRDLHSEQREQRATQREEHRQTAHDAIGDIREAHAEYLRGRLEESREARQERPGKAWTRAIVKTHAEPCRDEDGRFATCGVGRSRKWGLRNSPDWKKERKRRFNARMIRKFPFLKGKKIGQLVSDRTGGASPNEVLTPPQIAEIEAKRPSRVLKRLEAATADGPVITSVRTEPGHGIMFEDKRFYVGTVYRGKNDHGEAFNDRQKAYAFADRIQKYYVREIERDAKRRGKSWPHADDPPLPSATAILSNALDSLGVADAYHAGTLDGRQALDLLHAVRLEGRRWLRAQAEALLEDVAPDGEKALFGSVRAKVRAFFGQARKYVRELFAAGVLAVAGPDPSVLRDPVVQTAMAEQVNEQMTYLEAFEDRIVSEARPLGPAFVANAEQYGNAAWSGPQNTIRNAWKAGNLVTHEMREHLGPDEPCSTCQDQVALGWRPLGSLRAIGDSICMNGCHCAYRFRTRDGEEFYAGRGPLHEAAFGRTG